MRNAAKSDAWYLLAFFAFLISIGTLLLLLPFAYSGDGIRFSLAALVDALFMATSAVCVTGLAVLDISKDYSFFGQAVILSLIQIGGLGIISFTSIILTIPGNRLPLRRLKTIRGFYVDGVEYNPKVIIRSIVFFTIIIEIFGALALYPSFLKTEYTDPLWASVFHSISAFCNAGFSLFTDSLEGFCGQPAVLLVIAFLLISGGLGFIVLQDIIGFLRRKHRVINYHSKMVLLITTSLVLISFLLFLIFEWNKSFSEFSLIQKLYNAFFQAVTPRTAGFNAIPQSGLSQASKLLTMLLMFIGGAPGSIAGGIKVTTFFIVIVVMLRKPDRDGDIAFFNRRLNKETTNNAVVYFLKALFLLLLTGAALSIVEGVRGLNFADLMFEAISAFGTVGLSVGVTSSLSVLGRLIIIITMFAGRVGLIALAFPGSRSKDELISYPEASILLG